MNLTQRWCGVDVTRVSAFVELETEGVDCGGASAFVANLDAFRGIGEVDFGTLLLSLGEEYTVCVEHVRL